tara:strand:+ start:105 stop:746 length:642 start_codon:yes stop_codon:yes gene_type:complete
MAYRIDKTFDIADPFALLGGEGVIEEHLRVTIPAAGSATEIERTHILQIAEVAIRHVANLTGRNPVAGKFRVHLSGIPFRLDIPARIASLDAVEYLKQGATTYTALDLDSFGFHGLTAPGIIFSRDLISEPSDRDDDHPLPFRVTLSTLADSERTTDPADGTPAVDQVPMAFRHAALLYLSHLYENRAAVIPGRVVEMPLAFDHLVKSLLRIR